MTQFAFLLAIYGMTFTVADAKILSRPRDWLTQRSRFLFDLLSCYFCLGFWVGLCVNIVSFRAMTDAPIEYVEQVALGSFAGAAFCHAFNSFLLTLESHAWNPPKS